jgi:phosphoglycolate phosphatase
MQSKTIILFDLDGTLIDSTEAILESFSVSYKHFGTERPATEKILAQIGHPLDGMFRSFGVPEAQVWEYVAAYKEHYRQISKAKTLLLDGAKEAIEEACRIARLGIVTTKTARYSVELLEHMGIMDRFEVLIGREDVEYPKPHPEPILKALFKLKADTSDCWMIGDTCMDMLCAKAAGVKGVGVTCGYGSKEQLTDCCLLLSDDTVGAIDLIKKHK